MQQSRPANFLIAAYRRIQFLRPWTVIPQTRIPLSIPCDEILQRKEAVPFFLAKPQDKNGFAPCSESFLEIELI